MSDFTSGFWSVFITVITLVGIVGCGIFLWSQGKARHASGQTTGHCWDETLEEYNNPLPRWWSWMFYITIVFSLVYLALYPGLGSFKGIFGWTSLGQWQQEVDTAKAKYAPIFERYANMNLKEVAADPKAQEIGKNLYMTYCVQCHGSGGKGAPGYPNLTDNDWLYGGSEEVIKASIASGRTGIMPPYGGNPDAVGGEAGAIEIANFVRSLSDLRHDVALAEKGKVKFAQVCAACHKPDGTGLQALGAPNLTDRIWLYGSSEKAIVDGIIGGRNNKMPAWQGFIGGAKVHLLTAYIISLGDSGSSE